MPRVDGVRAAEEMRSLIARGVRPETPIVALSAACSPQEKERCRRAGIVAHLAKPLRLEMMSVLDGILSEARARRGRGGAAGGAAGGSGGRGGAPRFPAPAPPPASAAPQQAEGDERASAV